jgi:hypothetical protein
MRFKVLFKISERTAETPTQLVSEMTRTKEKPNGTEIFKTK